MKRTSVLVVCALACLFSAVLWPFSAVRVQASLKTIYVDVKNIGDPSQDGSVAHPFETIQKGIDAAGSGDMVQVAAGVYDESVQMNKSSVSLVGQKGGTVIDGNGTLPVGIRLYHTPPDYTENVSISGFTVQNCVKGITLSRSVYTRLRDNSMVGNTYNFGDYTLQVQDIDTSNTVDGRPIYFWVDQHDKQVPADAGFVALVSSTNMTIKNLDLTHNVQGLVLKNTTHSLIQNVQILNNWDGLYLERWSNSNTVIDNTISNNLYMGIYVSTSSSNTIANNSILGNAYGLLLDSTVFEYTIGYESMGNTVKYNVVTENTVANSSLRGVYLDDCHENLFFHNNFVNNTRQVESLNSTGTWDDGAEGNYWQDYSGKDMDKDGFGDTSYVIDESNRDNHPLMGLFRDFTLTWQEETYRISTVSNSSISAFGFSQPEKMISFSVSCPGDASGFCRVSVAVSLLGGPYTLVLNGTNSRDFLERSNGTHSFLYFTYNHSSLSVKIEGTSVVPEYPLFLLVFFLAILTIGTVIGTRVAIVTFTKRKFAPALSG
jgi:parallel beta-helix repeat protein